MPQGPIYHKSANHQVRDPRDTRFQQQRLKSWAAHHPGHPLRHGLWVVLRQVTLLLSVGVAAYAVWVKHVIG